MVKGVTLHVLVIEDHEMTAYGIRSRIMELLPESVCDTFVAGRTQENDVDRALSRMRYDLYITDLEIGQLSGVEVIGRIRALHKDARILVCTMHEEVWYVKELHKMKVDGVLFKSDSIDRLEEAVLDVASGKKWFCESYRNRVNGKSDAGRDYLLREKLTSHDMEVMQLLCKGCTTKEIAKQKVWSPSTVDHYRKRLFDKFGVSNSAQLAAVAVKEGFIKRAEV